MGLYLHRDKMISSLIKSDTLIGKNIKEVTDLLGTADSKLIIQNNELKIVYNVKTLYSGIEPIYYTDLVVYFDADTIVKQIKITEYNN